MKTKIVLKSLLGGFTLGFATASIMSFLDWRANPSGLFHNSQGTDWQIVTETFLSWFFPLFALMSILALPVIFWLSHRASKPGEE